jgi:hypothetical protein
LASGKLIFRDGSPMPHGHCVVFACVCACVCCIRQSEIREIRAGAYGALGWKSLAVVVVVVLVKRRKSVVPRKMDWGRRAMLLFWSCVCPFCSASIEALSIALSVTVVKRTSCESARASG